METHISVGGDTYRIEFLDHKPTRHDIDADLSSRVIRCGPDATTELLSQILRELASRSAARPVQAHALIPVLGFVQ